MITEQDINEESEKLFIFGIEHDCFKKGAKWFKEQSETSYINFIQQTELSQKDKDLVKGVFFDWLTTQ